jgi:hypothetical protein
VRRFLWVIALLWAVPSHAEPTFIGSYIWESDDLRFGGFSGIEVFPGGTNFIALSDRGTLMTGKFQRTDHAITDAELVIVSPLRGTDGALLGPKDSDSEGIAVDQNGDIYLSFEANHGIRVFEHIMGNASPLITTPFFADMQVNSSLEALAIGPDGALYTLPERSGMATKPFPVFRYRDGIWDQPFEIARRGPYLMSGADIGPDGRLYLLERDFVGIGFRNRIRRFALDGTGEEVILETRIRKHDNMEGISVWRDDAGLVMTLISDDNFRAFQRTEIAEYRLTD